MIKIENNQVYSSEGKYVHRIGSDGYFKRGTLLPNDTASNFEEVDEIPPYSEDEYKQKVAELIHQRYSPDDETGLVNNFLKKDATDVHRFEYSEYQSYRDYCKQKAKEILLSHDNDGSN